MKTLVIATALAAVTSIAPAGAARDARPLDVVDKTTATVIADASHLGTASLTGLNGGAPGSWAPTGRQVDPDFDAPATPIDPGMLLVALGLAVMALARPVSRVLRRHEQHRRAAALASTLGHTPRG